MFSPSGFKIDIYFCLLLSLTYLSKNKVQQRKIIWYVQSNLYLLFSKPKHLKSLIIHRLIYKLKNYFNETE